MRGSEFVVDSADALYYDLNKISLSRGGLYVDSPEWLKNNKATLNQKTNDDKSFQYALTIALNYKQIKKDLQRISKIKSFIDQYNWKEIFHHIEKINQLLIANQLISQLLLIFCMCFILLKK